MLVIGAALVLVFSAIFFLRNRPTVPIEAPPASSNGFHGRPAASDVPSKDNVNNGYVEQVNELKKAVEVNPRNTNHLAMLARLLMDGHQAADAIPYFERAARLQPKNDSLLLDLSVCYSIVKNYDTALEVTDRLLVHNPNNLTALYNKGALLATLGNNAEAARCWKKIVSAAPASEAAKKARAGLTAIGA